MLNFSNNLLDARQTVCRVMEAHKKSQHQPQKINEKYYVTNYYITGPKTIEQNTARNLESSGQQSITQIQRSTQDNHAQFPMFPISPEINRTIPQVNTQRNEPRIMKMQ